MYNVAGLYLMEIEDADQFNEVRSSVYGITTDQGAELGISDASVNFIPAYQGALRIDGPSEFLVAKSINHDRTLACTIQRLGRSVQELPRIGSVLGQLQSICNLLSQVQLRRKFQSTCLSGRACNNLPIISHGPTSIGDENSSGRLCSGQRRCSHTSCLF